MQYDVCCSFNRFYAKYVHMGKILYCWYLVYKNILATLSSTLLSNRTLSSTLSNRIKILISQFFSTILNCKEQY